MNFFTKRHNVESFGLFSGGAKSNQTETKSEQLSLLVKLKTIYQLVTSKTQSMISRERKILVGTMRKGYIQSVIKEFMTCDGLSNPELNAVYYHLLNHVHA